MKLLLIILIPISITAAGEIEIVFTQSDFCEVIDVMEAGSMTEPEIAVNELKIRASLTGANQLYIHGIFSEDVTVHDIEEPVSVYFRVNASALACKP